MSSRHTSPKFGNQNSEIDRRQFSRQMITTAATGGMLFFLAGCSSQNSTLNWYHEFVQHNSLNKLTALFNRLYPDITINPLLIPPATPPDQAVLDKFNADLYPDIVALDVVWLRRFVKAGLVIPLDNYWSEAERKNYLSTPMKMVNFDGHIWAAPLHTDAGVLFYRTDMPDIIQGKPEEWTWQDIKNMALDAMRQKKVEYGFLWQGIQGEPLVCNFVEILSSFGGRILTNDTPPGVVINGPQARAALQHMIEWIYGEDLHQKNAISPLYVLNDDEPGSSSKWLKESGAAFMRNWPGSVFWSQDGRDNFTLTDRFAITSLPGKASCLGGWQLAITKGCSNRGAAWQFIHWMIQEDVQRYLATNEAFSVTLTSMYTDPYIQAQNPLYSKLPAIIQSAQSRPLVAYYDKATLAIQADIHKTLTNPETYPPTQALAHLQQVLEALVKENA